VSPTTRGWKVCGARCLLLFPLSACEAWLLSHLSACVALSSLSACVALFPASPLCLCVSSLTTLPVALPPPLPLCLWRYLLPHLSAVALFPALPLCLCGALTSLTSVPVRRFHFPHLSAVALASCLASLSVRRYLGGKRQRHTGREGGERHTGRDVREEPGLTGREGKEQETASATHLPAPRRWAHCVELVGRVVVILATAADHSEPEFRRHSLLRWWTK
jgi:hypothetical protein